MNNPNEKYRSYMKPLTNFEVEMFAEYLGSDFEE